MQKQADATIKAKDLIRMGVAKAALLEPQEAIISEVQIRALVIGGGLAGMTAALALASREYEVVLVEKEEILGGVLTKLNRLAPTLTDAHSFVDQKIQAINQHPQITVFTKACVTEAQGFIGKYEVHIETESGLKNIDIGVIIVATGGRILVPEGLYNYDGQRVITQLELEALLKEGL
ncbi:unnamed protein product, partial [marine sediment metagenome]